VLGASAWLPFLPMQPVQLLVRNFLYNFSQTAIPFLKKPRRWEVSGIARFMLLPGTCVVDFRGATFCLMWFLFGARTPATQSLFQPAWFVEGLPSQTLIVHVIRTRRIPLTSAVMLAGLAIPFTALGAALGLRPLPLPYFAWPILILATYVDLAQVVKTWFARKYGYYRSACLESVGSGAGSGLEKPTLLRAGRPARHGC
jgi:Mg2+-importing ATPase